jgi:membrane protease YdiL (CAAX protease family)
VRRAVHDVVRSSGRWTGTVVSGSVAAFAAERLVVDPLGSLSSMTWILPVLLPLGGIGYLLAGLVFRRLRPVDSREIAPPSWVYSAIVGVGIGAAGLLLANVITFAGQLIGLEGEEQALVLELSRGGPLAVGTLVLLAVTVAPVGEELFFRGHVFRYLSVRAGTGIAYLASTVIFAVVHLNPSAFPAYLVAGGVLAWTYRRWRCLRIPMIAHATWNAISVGFLLLV